MRPIGTTQQLAERRQRALDLLGRGQSPQQVAEQVGVTDRSVRRWQSEVKHLPRPARRKPGRPRRLTAAQLRRLVRALQCGAFAFGYAEDYWTLDRIAHVIWELFQIRYRPSGVWYLMQALGWSSQKPQRRPLQRDEDAIGHWKRYQWPQVKKCRERQASLVFPDESGFSLVSLLKRTWAPRGQTPVLRTSLEHNQRLNLMGAICLTPGGRKLKLCLQSHWKSLNGDHVIAFLEHLLRRVRGPIVMVWDKHPMHRQRQVKAFLLAHPRIQLYPFPTCAPELNPAEFVWTQVSEYTANTAPHNKVELAKNVRAGIARTRGSQVRLWACTYASGLPWKR